ncbi:MAG: PEP/pyruvate-binding domain-containing protein [Candidatus Limnocylindria bacterium]
MGGRSTDTRSVTPDIVLPLAEVTAQDVAVAGGKGANLGELVRAGFPVPHGFVITTEAYARAGRTGDGLGAAAARVRLTTTPVPSEVATAIVAAYRELGGGRVAVRSSATAEDLPDASFAGQQDTFLNVEGTDAVLDAVRRCWASLWNERAIAYRATHAVDERSLGLAVVVQTMVDAAIAGVLFTADPITGRRRRAAIDAVRGLGDALVSGAVNPDHYLVDVRSGEVLDRTGDILDDARLRVLAALGARVEEHYGRPQDIEWAIDGHGALFLVQSRAITTLYPIPQGAPDRDGDLHVYLSANVAQGMFQPFTPLGAQTFKLIGSGLSALVGAPLADTAAGPSILSEAGMRLWIDLTPVLRSRVGRGIPARLLSGMEARSKPVITRLLEDPRLGTRGSGIRSITGIVKALRRTGAPPVLIRALLRPDATRRQVTSALDSIVREDPGPLSTASGRIDAFERIFLTRPPLIFPRLVALVASGFLAHQAASRILGIAARPDELQTALRGLRHNPTTEMDLELWAIARDLKSDSASRTALAQRSPQELSASYAAGSLPPLLQRALARFLERYGHRTIAEIDIGVPRWSEDPAHLLGAIANYHRLEDTGLAPDLQFARGAREADAMIATLLGRVQGPRRVAAAALFRRVRRLSGLRELPKFTIVRLLALGRRVIAPVGVELAAAGRIEVPDDVWFLTLPELRRAANGEDARGIVSGRRAEYRREVARRHIPRVLLSDGTDAEAAFAAPALPGDLVGTPASPGAARGVARVLWSPSGAVLEPGDVLVAPATDPGWTPLFLTASALVMEMGGMMSHGAVVAREYGIPAVVGVRDATSRIMSGQHVVVDGSAGTVAVEEGEHPPA